MLSYASGRPHTPAAPQTEEARADLPTAELQRALPKAVDAMTQGTRTPPSSTTSMPGRRRGPSPSRQPAAMGGAQAHPGTGRQEPTDASPCRAAARTCSTALPAPPPRAQRRRKGEERAAAGRGSTATPPRLALADRRRRTPWHATARTGHHRGYRRRRDENHDARPDLPPCRPEPPRACAPPPPSAAQASPGGVLRRRRSGRWRRGAAALGFRGGARVALGWATRGVFL